MVGKHRVIYVFNAFLGDRFNKLSIRWKTNFQNILNTVHVWYDSWIRRWVSMLVLKKIRWPCAHGQVYPPSQLCGCCQLNPYQTNRDPLADKADQREILCWWRHILNRILCGHPTVNSKLQHYAQHIQNWWAWQRDKEARKIKTSFKINTTERFAFITQSRTQLYGVLSTTVSFEYEKPQLSKSG